MTKSLKNRIEAVKDSMRESGYSFSEFVHEDAHYMARLKAEPEGVYFTVTAQGGELLVIRELIA